MDDPTALEPPAGISPVGSSGLVDTAIIAAGGARVALGLTALAAPRIVSRAFGISGDIEAARYLGGRDLVTGLGILLGHRRGRARGWLEAAAIVDALDTVVTLTAASRGRMAVGRALGVATIAAGSAVSAALLAQAVGEEQR